MGLGFTFARENLTIEDVRLMQRVIETKDVKVNALDKRSEQRKSRL